MFLWQLHSARPVALAMPISISVQPCCLADSFLSMSLLADLACKPGLTSLLRCPEQMHMAKFIRCAYAEGKMTGMQPVRL